jgi:hypothetical protein
MIVTLITMPAFQTLAQQQAQREDELALSQRHILTLQVSYQLSRHLTLSPILVPSE